MLVSDTLTPSPSALLLPPSGGYQRQRVTLADPGSYSVTLPTLNPSDKNSAVNVVFQVQRAKYGSIYLLASEASLPSRLNAGYFSVYVMGTGHCYMILNTSEKFNVVLNNYSEKIELPFFHCWVVRCWSKE